MKDTREIRELMLEGPELRLRLLVSGNPQGRPVLFLHGITENAMAFEPILRALPEDLYALSLDWRGRGASDKPESGYGVREYTEDLVTVWNHFSGHADKPLLVGHSMGGRAACAFAALYPELACGVVLIDPPISGPGRRPFPMPLARFLEPKRALAAGDMPLFRSYYSGAGFDYDRKAKELAECSEQAIAQSYEAMNKDSFHTYYRMLRIPALLITAGLSPLITADDEEELSSLNPSVLVKRFEDVGHEVHKLAPDRLVREMLDFLSSLS
ncbi:alpha/beta hydrolase [Cohnella lubricantis]|uniref:Alpha/beta hydrolase n=1 Tax=Cohnella lubricantis TaxID=2163172 RepID=A0A841T6I9_9BACL|nr:alpha/beta hydrolase [Cohnella lubricantis]MBB6677153.1 alpha/beta hydrolase [Cohnella lubricantis]MBP2117036.1 N-formylmaleamate deformylase [Cohnella lubricantis]